MSNLPKHGMYSIHSAPRQSMTSRNTSLRQVPAYLKKLPKGHGATLLDYGCGRNWRAIQRQMRNKGYKYHGFDPHWNNKRGLLDKHYDLVTCCNVLNVLDSMEAIVNCIEKCLSLGDRVVFQVYEGDRSGTGRVTKADCWQCNYPASTYVNLIKSLTNREVTRKGNCIHVEEEK